MLAYFDGLDPVYIAKHPAVIILLAYVRLNTCTMYTVFDYDYWNYE